MTPWRCPKAAAGWPTCRSGYAQTMYEVAGHVDAVALLTEWKELRMPDWTQLRATMRGDVNVDGRNIFDKPEVEAAGFRRRNPPRCASFDLRRRKHRHVEDRCDDA